MNFLTEKKAKERYQNYLQAEIKGDDKQATLIEKELNDAGWYIVSTPEGETVQRKGLNGEFPDVNDYLPKEENYDPYKPDSDADKDSAKKVWIIVGVTLGVAALVMLTIYLIKRVKNGRGN